MTQTATQEKLWGWKIIKDNVADNDEESQVGKIKRDYQGGQHRYRLKDDDGEIYYYLLSDIDGKDGYEDELFAPLDWGTWFAGCSSIEWKNPETGKYEYL